MRARASVRGDGSREEERTVAASPARRESFPWPSAKEERRGQAGDTSPSAGRWGVYGNFFFGETVMHVSPISVTKRLLAAFCPRDNSPPFFMAAPISRLKNYSRKVGTLRSVGEHVRWIFIFK